MTPLKIVGLEVENVKKLRAISLRPDGTMVAISGENGVGKTSILDAIWWALDGNKSIQSDPIRHGALWARIKVDMGEMIVTRSFTKPESGEKKFGTTLKIQMADGSRPAKPQQMLDALIGTLTFDPLDFARSKPDDKFQTLKQLVPGYDFDAAERANKIDFDERTEANRRAKQARAAIAAMPAYDGLPLERVDTAALAGQLTDIQTANDLIDRRAERRESTRAEIRTKSAEVDRLHDEADALEQQARDKRAAAEIVAADVDTLSKMIDTAGPLPEKTDTTELMAKLRDAGAINQRVDEATKRQKLIEDARLAEADSERLTKAMEARDAAMEAAIAEAKLPVDSLRIVGQTVMLGDVPFDQGSDAEQLRASLAIAMALNPQLRVLRVRDGSLLSEKSLEIVRAMAADRDYQVWVELVGNRPGTVIIEDGMVVAEPEPATETKAYVEERQDSIRAGARRARASGKSSDL